MPKAQSEFVYAWLQSHQISLEFDVNFLSFPWLLDILIH